MENFIRYYPDVFPAKLCKSFIKQFRSDKSNQTQSDPSAPKTLLISTLDPWIHVDQLLQESIKRLLNVYCREFGQMLSSVIPDKLTDSGYFYQSYSNKEDLKWHINSDSKETFSRQLVVIWYLNESSGGETEFLKYGKINPKAGHAVIFPANWLYLYRECKLLKGSKHCIIAFLGPN